MAIPTMNLWNPSISSETFQSIPSTSQLTKDNERKLFLINYVFGF